ncbi:MAG: TonB-dependent receptor [Proteobacteria bacterium]|nr:TonB-dependent receptor [Pseudomonadota bacterium]
MRILSLPSAIRSSLYGAAALSCLVAPASFAQDKQPAEKKETATLDAVEVLGSRIKRTDLETAQPVLTIERAELERTGLTNLGDVLKELAINGPSLSLNTNNGNTSGVQRVSLRACGSNRTLVLVNGKRWISDVGLGGSVDLSSIPMAAIENVQILKDGASALYGTDAICGVVNFNTKRNWSGAQLNTYYGQYDQDDGVTKAADLTIGHKADRWSVLVNASWKDQGLVSAGNRAISAVPIYGFPANVSTPGRASPTTPYGNFSVGGKTLTLDPSKAGCAPNQVCTAAGDFRPYDFSKDGYNFAPVNILTQPQTTKGLFGEATYNLTDNLRVRFNGFLNQRGGNAQLAAQPLSSGSVTIGGVVYPKTLLVSKDSVYNPFGVNITSPTFRPILFPRLYDQNQLTRRFSVDLEGDFEAFDRPFNWDVGASYAKNKFNLIKGNFEDFNKFKLATGPSFILNGKAVCGTPSAPIDGCVPFNLFGGPNGVTADMFNYVKADLRNVQRYRVDNYWANISGPVVALPAGDLSVAVGLEYRKESGSDTPDPLTAAGNALNDVPYQPTHGGYNVKEVYGELAVPILKEAPFAYALDLSVAGRHSDYSSFGSTDNPKVSLQWRPIEDLLVRGSWGKGFRAPSIGELYSGIATGRPSATDPCSATSATANVASVQANCAAAGVKPGFKNQNAQTFLSTGGNPLLQPETSTNKTLGFVYSPPFLEGFDVSVDWYNIQLKNQIGSRGAQGIIDGCYINGIADRCKLITRDLTGAMFNNPGEIINIVGLNQNFKGGFEVEGVDFSLHYKFKTENWGDFKLNLDNAYITYLGDLGQLERGQITADGDISGGNGIGKTGSTGASGGSTQFRLRSTFNAVWNYRDFTFSGTLERYSKIVDTCNVATNTAIALAARGITTGYTNYCTNPTFLYDTYKFNSSGQVVSSPQVSPRTTFHPMVYVDIQAAYRLPWKAQVSAGIRNLFDKDPPFSSDAFANSFDPQYRIPGRFFYASYTQNFDLF